MKFYYEHNLLLESKSNGNIVLLTEKMLLEDLSNFKPILRKLTVENINKVFYENFDKDIDIRTFSSEEFFEKNGFFKSFDEMLGLKIEWWPLGIINLLTKYHFDIFNLIDKNLAIEKK